MVDLTNIHESSLTKFHVAHLPTIIKLNGVLADHYRKVIEIEDEVYGINSGLNTDDLPATENVKILVSSFQWRVLTSFDGSYLDDTGYMYCLIDLHEGDYFKFKRLNIEHGFIVTFAESLGLTTTPITRFKISNVSI